MHKMFVSETKTKRQQRDFLLINENSASSNQFSSTNTDKARSSFAADQDQNNLINLRSKASISATQGKDLTMLIKANTVTSPKRPR